MLLRRRRHARRLHLCTARQSERKRERGAHPPSPPRAPDTSQSQASSPQPMLCACADTEITALTRASLAESPRVQGGNRDGADRARLRVKRTFEHRRPFCPQCSVCDDGLHAHKVLRQVAPSKVDDAHVSTTQSARVAACKRSSGLGAHLGTVGPLHTPPAQPPPLRTDKRYKRSGGPWPRLFPSPRLPPKSEAAPVACALGLRPRHPAEQGHLCVRLERTKLARRSPSSTQSGLRGALIPSAQAPSTTAGASPGRQTPPLAVPAARSSRREFSLPPVCGPEAQRTKEINNCSPPSDMMATTWAPCRRGLACVAVSNDRTFVDMTSLRPLSWAKILICVRTRKDGTVRQA